LLQLYLYI